MHHAQGSRPVDFGNGRALPARLEAIDGVATISSRQKIERERGIGADEALAIAAYRRYTWERRSGKDAPNHRYDHGQGRPKNNPSTSIYDARIVRKIDFERCLATIGEYFSTILKLYHVDGESQSLIAHATGRSIRSIVGDLPNARRALAEALDKADML